jgi:hypothetical protein
MELNIMARAKIILAKSLKISIETNPSIQKVTENLTILSLFLIAVSI